MQAKNEWETNLKAKELQHKIKNDVDKLSFEIVHGKFVNAQLKNYNKNIQNLVPNHSENLDTVSNLNKLETNS